MAPTGLSTPRNTTTPTSSLVTPAKTATHTYIASPNHTPPTHETALNPDLQSKQGETLGNPQFQTTNEQGRVDLMKFGSLVIDLQGAREVNEEIENNGNKTPWTALLKNLPQSAGKEELTFHEPIFKDGYLQLDEEICEIGAKEWEDTVVGYFIDKKLPFSLVKSTVEKKWQLQGEVETLLDGDLYYFNFTNSQDRDDVLEEGSFHMMGKLFIIRPWSREVEDDRGQISVVPIWVNFYKVPKYYWNPTGLSMLASTIGKPICLDKNTESKKMLTFARVCIDVDATKELQDTIPTRSGTTTGMVEIAYAWKPLICTDCKKFGHNTSTCWKQKENTSELNNKHQGWKTNKFRRARKQKKRTWEIPDSPTKNTMDDEAGRNSLTTTNRYAVMEGIDKEFSFQANNNQDEPGHEQDGNAMEIEVETSSCYRILESANAQMEEDTTAETRIEDGVADKLTRNMQMQAQGNHETSATGNDQLQQQPLNKGGKQLLGKGNNINNSTGIPGHGAKDVLKHNGKEKFHNKMKKTGNQVQLPLERDCPPGFESLSTQQQHSSKMSEVASSLIASESKQDQENLVNIW